MRNVRMMACALATMMVLGVVAFGQSEAPETTKLSMVSESNKVLIKIENGEITAVTVNDKEVPKERVRLVGKGLEVVNEKGDVVGAMANLSAGSKSPLRQAPKQEAVPVYNDNPELKVEIRNNRFLVVTLKGEPVPPNRVRFEGNAIKIYNENGDVLRVIRADSPQETDAPVATSPQPHQ